MGGNEYCCGLVPLVWTAGRGGGGVITICFDVGRL